MKTMSRIGRPTLINSVFGGLLINGAFLLFLSSCEQGKAETKKEKVAAVAPKLPVDVKIVKPSKFDQKEVLVGTVLPHQEVTIVSEISKKVTSIAFTDGSYIRKGQLLYKLADSDLRAQLKKVESQLKLAQLDQQRFSELLKTNAVKQQEYDQIYTTLQTLEAEKELHEVEIAKTEIRAPFSGNIGISRIDVGSVINSSTVLTTLQDLHRVKIQFTVPEKYSDLVKKGGKVIFTTETHEKPFSATISATEPGVDAQTRGLVVEAIAENQNQKLRSGLSAKVHFNIYEDNSNAFTIPSESLIPAATGYTVYVVRGGIAKMQPVKVLNRSENEALIGEGLQSGDTVMTSNILRTTDGTAVQIVSAQ